MCNNFARVCKRVSVSKVYRSLFRFGIETDTLDPEGQITATSQVIPTRAQIEAILPSLTGEVEIEVPKFSAVHINGKRAYDLARNGVDFKSPTKIVNVYRFEIISSPKLVNDWFEIECQTGTYIRSLAKLLAQKLGTVAIAQEIIRTRVGNFKIEDAKSPDHVALENILPVGGII